MQAMGAKIASGETLIQKMVETESLPLVVAFSIDQMNLDLKFVKICDLKQNRLIRSNYKKCYRYFERDMTYFRQYFRKSLDVSDYSKGWKRGALRIGM